MKKPPIKQFTTPIHYITTTDTLREVLQYIHFKDGNILATNAYIAVVIPLKRFGFDATDIEKLNGHSIHRSQFMLIQRKEITVVDDAIIVDTPRFTIPLKKTSDIERNKIVNDIEPLFDLHTTTKTPLSEIGINPILLVEIAKALGIRYALHLFMFAANRAIIIEGNDGNEKEYGKGLVMPSMIYESR